MFIKNDKFAILCLGNIATHQSLPERLNLPNGYEATRELPIIIDPTWRESIGTIEYDHIEDASLFVTHKLISQTPEILDYENCILDKKLNYFYYALHLTGYTKEHRSSNLLSGYSDIHGPKIRGVSKLERSYFVPGTPYLPALITRDRLLTSAKLAWRIEEMYEGPHCGRFKRLFHSFICGLRDRYFEMKLHKFIRCLEGFVLPPENETRRKLKSRSELFIGPSHHSLIDDLYRLRSEEEHLHDVMDYFGKPLITDNVVELCRHTLIAETIAKYCISRFLLSPNLWEHFKNDDSIKAFWKLGKVEQENLWGDRLDIRRVISDFDKEDRSLRHL